MSILNFPWWRTRSTDAQVAPIKPFKPSASVIRGYAADIEKYGRPLDSGLPDYFRKCAEYFEIKDKEQQETIPHD